MKGAGGFCRANVRAGQRKCARPHEDVGAAGQTPTHGTLPLFVTSLSCNCHSAVLIEPRHAFEVLLTLAKPPTPNSGEKSTEKQNILVFYYFGRGGYLRFDYFNGREGKTKISLVSCMLVA